MIDLHFPRVLTEMVRIMHLDGISRISELTEVIKQMNPLKIKDELINKHKFYEFKMKQFLMALVLGMRPAKIYNGLIRQWKVFYWWMEMEKCSVIINRKSK